MTKDLGERSIEIYELSTATFHECHPLIDQKMELLGSARERVAFATNLAEHFIVFACGETTDGLGVSPTIAFEGIMESIKENTAAEMERVKEQLKETDKGRESAATGRPSTSSEGAKNGDDEPLALIEELLARPEISNRLREELEEFKMEIANGTLEASDHHYICALHARLTKNL